MSLLPEGPGLVEGTGVVGSNGRVLFLDRDGVINVNLGYVHTPQQTQWVDGIFELCAQAHAKGISIVIATNQAGIARGYYDIATFERYTQWMHAQFAERGIMITATLYCPHHPGAGDGPFTIDCGCRKPAPGMLIAAARHYGIDLPGAVMVGDKVSDMQAAGAAGVRRLYLLDGDVGEGVACEGVIHVPRLSVLQAVL